MGSNSLEKHIMDRFKIRYLCVGEKVNKMSTPRNCKWKQGIAGKSPDGKVQQVNFPCRYPNDDLTTDLCTQCLLGDLFSMLYTQTMSFRKSADMQEEIMAFLKSFTTEDFDMR